MLVRVVSCKVLSLSEPVDSAGDGLEEADDRDRSESWGEL